MAQKIVDYRIVISENARENEKRAALFLRNAVRLVTGKLLPLVTDNESPADRELVVGVTNREAEGFFPERSRKGLYEYIIKSDNNRVFISGLGIPDTPGEYLSAYKYVDDGAIGTLMAVYRFTEDVLGYNFIYDSYAYLPENPDTEIPDGYFCEYTSASLKVKDVPLYDETAMYMLPVTESLELNIMSFIFKTKSGKIVVVDGGKANETENLLALLQKLAPEGETPTVSAWFLTHLHEDHYGSFLNIVRNYDVYGDRVKIENFYCNLLEEDFYTKLSKEANVTRKALRYDLLAADVKTGCVIHTVNTGDVIEIDGLSFKAIHTPDMKDAANMNMNDSCIVYKLTVDGKQTIMFLSDSEWVCNNDLLNNHKDELKSDIVQVGHHGCGNVSKDCYAAIGADIYLWQLGNKYWYGEKGEGIGTFNTGVIRTRNYIRSLGVEEKNIYLDRHGMLSFTFPIEKK